MTKNKHSIPVCQLFSRIVINMFINLQYIFFLQSFSTISSLNPLARDPNSKFYELQG